MPSSAEQPVVAIVGRPNVGKSTLFNRLAGKRLAVVDDQPGVTRDWREAQAAWGEPPFVVVDTAGLDQVFESETEARIQAQTERTLDRADLVLFVIDCRAGVTPLDQQFARSLRRRGRPVVLVANKAEGRAGDAGLLESYALGLGEAVAVSAEHGDGIGDLLRAVADALAAALPAAAPAPQAAPAADAEAVLKLAVIGRPNSGKSTLVNRLLGEERVVSGPEPGLTRDAVAIDWHYQGRAIQLVDTAGLRRRTKVRDRVEQLSIKDTLRTIDFAHIAVLLLDATEGPGKQDMVIANHVIAEGRGLVVAANKWDLVGDPAKTFADLGHRLDHTLSQVKGVPLVRLSALHDQGIAYLMDAVFSLYRQWNRRVPTARLNQWLAAVTAEHPPPMSAGRRVKIRYITQTGIRPPSFTMFVNRPDALADSYLRYLVNALRDSFAMTGTPIRLHPRAGRNPYTGPGNN